MKASIPPETIAEIRRLKAAGLSTSDVARLVGVNRSTVKKYQSDEHVERRREISARNNAKMRAKERESLRLEPPSELQAVKTAIPLLRKLFDTAWKRRVQQRTLAKAARVSPNTIQNWKKGVAEPTFRNLEAVADSLGFEIVLRPKSVLTSQHAIHQTTLPDAPL
jgi:transcriptional regulator with XRE-family HTH domain